jgi:hypothetical protein
LDFKFRAQREEDGGIILNWIADRMIALADWLYVKFGKYSMELILELKHDEREDD